jgi:hypothetical protein
MFLKIPDGQPARAVRYGALLVALSLGCASAFAQTQLFPLLNQLPITANPPAGLGDVNPYGIAFVPKGIKAQANSSLVNAGDLLVSNFNNANNIAGTGTTITRITPQGQLSNFFTATPGHGLTNGLVILQNGMVIVGSLPTDANMKPQNGSIFFLNRLGKGIPITYNGGTQIGSNAGELTNQMLTGTLRNGPLLNPIQGPWSFALDDSGTGTAHLYVSMVLSGTVWRFDFMYDSDIQNVLITAITQIGFGFAHKPDATGLVLGPAGLFHFTKVDPITRFQHDDLYVANSADDTIYMITDAGWTTTSVTTTATGMAIHVIETTPDPNNAGATLQSNPLHGPLGLTLAPNGHLLVANSDPAASNNPNHPSELIEFATDGTFISRLSIDPNTGGAFGVTFMPLAAVASELAFVNDNQVAVGKVTFAAQ